jgi:hypothetical protein
MLAGKLRPMSLVFALYVVIIVAGLVAAIVASAT